MQEAIEDLDYSVVHSPPEEGAPFERLQVLIGVDSEERPLSLQLSFINDVALAVGAGEDEEDTHDAIFLQFILLFPVPVGADHIPGLMAYLMQINRILPVGGFGVSQPDGTVYYQYNLALPERDIDENVLLEVVQIIDFFVNKFQESIGKVSTGALASDGALQQMRDEGIFPPPMSAGAEA